MPDINKAFKIWIPQVKDEIFKAVTITDSDSTIHTIDGNLTNFDITWPTIRGGGLASFTLTLNNNEREYLDVFTEGNVVKFYFDYTDGTTLYKSFKMAKPKYGYQNGYKVFIHGRDYPEVADEKVTYDWATGVAADEGFRRVIADKFSSVINNTDISTSMTESIAPQYESISGIKVFKDILERVNYDGRIEADDDVITFVDTGVLTTTESCIIGQNIKSVSGFGAQSDNEKNRTQVVGGVVEDCPILRMKESTTQQTASWIKDEIYKNTNILNLTDAEEVATFKDADKATLPDSGTITSIGMATIKPGQLIPCSAPDCKIVGNYFVKCVKHKFTSSEGWVTEIDINETKTLTSTFLEDEKNRRENERELKNPNEMHDTLILLTFDNEEGINSKTNLTVTRGKLVLDSGISQAVMLSDSFEADSNWTEYEVRAKYNDDMSLVKIEVGNDDGYSFQETGIEDLNIKQTLTTTGKRGRLRVTLISDADNAKPELDSIALLIRR